MENVKFYDDTHREVDFNDISITWNTRTAYPLEHIPNAKIPSIGGHPKNIILLTCDSQGVLPPVAKLSKEQALYFFQSGFTSYKPLNNGRQMNLNPSFSACFSEAFLPRHPTLYTELLAKKIQKNPHCNVWLVNTGWINGKHEEGQRIPLKLTRAIIDAIHSGELDKVEYTESDVFKLKIPKAVHGVPSEILDPSKTAKDKDAFKASITTLAEAFIKNFEKYKDETSKKLVAAGPQLK